MKGGDQTPEGEIIMTKFIQFTTTETKDAMKLYAQLEDGSLHHIRDYDYLYEGDVQFYRNAEGILVDVYSHYGVSYEIRDGKLFEITFDEYNGQGWEEEIEVSMLLAN